MNATTRNILVMLATIILVGGIFSMVTIDHPKTVDVGTFVSRVQNGQVDKVAVQGSKLDVTFKDDQWSPWRKYRRPK
jgi:hypothetical protein